jgi:serpin B
MNRAAWVAVSGLWLLFAAVGANSCSSSGGGGTNTNWVTCETDSDCPANQTCEENRCAPAGTFLQSTLPHDRDSGADPGVVAQIADGNTAFALDLYGALRGGGGNLFFSPFSISVAMAMAWAGANGGTESEIATVFHFPEPQATTHAALDALSEAASVDGTDLVTHLASSLWVAPSIHPLGPYLDTLSTYYGAGVGVVDFGNPSAAASTIDDWVSGETAGTISRLLEPSDLNSTTQAVLTNAVYFKGKWASTFSPSDTFDDTFTLGDGSTVPVKMMEQTESMPYADAPDYQAAAVPFRAAPGRNYELLVVLPKGDFTSFESGLDAQAFDDVLGSLGSASVILLVPRFSLHAALSLADTLSAMGMPSAFTGEADFSNLVSSPKLHIDKVLHQGFLSIDESGALATGATAITFADGGIAFPPPPELTLNRPFLLFIRQIDTGTLLFAGRVTNPNE